MKYDRENNRWALGKHGAMIWAFKMTIVGQNIFKSQNRQLDRIK
jgi:hypothetical protein